MAEQMVLFDPTEELPKTTATADDKAKRNWESGFQKWSDNQASDEETPLGCCGYGSMCGWCEDSSYGRPCVRALNAMCREKRIAIDYSKRNYEDIWNGVFEND